MLSKPAIPIWIDVDANAVKTFSPILATHKAIIYEANPYDVAEQVRKVLMRDKQTHFYKAREGREEAVVFWQLVYLYILVVLRREDPDEDEGLNSLNKMPTEHEGTIQDHIRKTVKIPPQKMIDRAELYRSRAKSIGNEIRDEDISHLICGEIKREQAWFPYEPREHHALQLIGLDRFN
jgi:hypothetical protein